MVDEKKEMEASSWKYWLMASNLQLFTTSSLRSHTVNTQRRMFEGKHISMWGCARVSVMIELYLTSHKQALALMKGCCHLFCRSVTIGAPSGSSDRRFFCITLNLRVQGINLTLLGETKDGPLMQYNSTVRMSATATTTLLQCYYSCLTRLSKQEIDLV